MSGGLSSLFVFEGAGVFLPNGEEIQREVNEFDRVYKREIYLINAMETKAMRSYVNDLFGILVSTSTTRHFANYFFRLSR